jgi:hydrogenase nickel incorporation protein HypA/HybF
VRPVHELGLSEAIVEATLRRAGDRRVRRVKVRVGGGHAADPAALRLGFEIAAAGTVAEGTVVEVVVDPLRVRCASCGEETVRDDGMVVPACPACGGVDVELAGIGDVTVEEIALEGPQ